MQTFAELVCGRWKIPPERYMGAVFWRCLHRRALPVAWMFRWWHDEHFLADYDLISRVGSLTCANDLEAELDDFDMHPWNHGMLRRRLKIRVSVGRLSKLVRATLPSARETTPRGYRLDDGRYPREPGLH